MKFIRDCIYNYIPVSDLEVKILQQPEILRLHRVLQNSTVFHTYPNNRNSRFSHSIGAMHVSGLMFKSMISNSRDSFVHQIHQTLQNYLDQNFPNSLEKSRQYLIERYEKSVLSKEFFMNYGWNMRTEYEKKDELEDGGSQIGDYYNTLNNIIFQAVRLAALVHDIGHPTYSHVVEMALADLSIEQSGNLNSAPVVDNIKDLIEKYQRAIRAYSTAGLSEYTDVPKVHEMVGIILINSYSRALYSTETDEYLFFQTCWSTALRILAIDQMPHYRKPEFTEAIRVLKTSNKDYGTDLVRQIFAFYPLGNIINSSVDCDRLDYLRRDAYSSGLTEMGNFDSERIINSAVIISPEPKFFDDFGVNLFCLGFERRSLSALSDFFNDRMRQYRWLVNHHNVVRTDLAMVRLIMRLAEISLNNKSKEIVDHLKNYCFYQLWNWKNIEKELRYLDDAWFDNLLHQLLKILYNKKSLDQDESEVIFFLKVLYERKVNTLFALWKRLDDFIPFAEAYYNAFTMLINKKPIPSMDELSSLVDKSNLPSHPTEYVYFVNQTISLWKKKSGKKVKDYNLLREIEMTLSAKIGKQIFLVFKSVHPYESVPILIGDGNSDNTRISYLDEISSFVQSLDQIWNKELMLYAYEKVDDRGLKKINHFEQETFLRHLGSLMGEEVYSQLHSYSTK